MSKASAALLLPGSLQQIQAVMTGRLSQLSDTPGLEAQVLLAHVLGQPRSWILAHPDIQLDPVQSEKLSVLTERRIGGEPLPYILGKWEFFGLEFTVTPAVLIPRPETELLVEQALAWLKEEKLLENPHLCIADIGTGTGCIAISLAIHAARKRIVAVDVSPQALDVASQNTQKHQVEAQVQLVQGNLLETFSSHSFHLVCANLPYIPSQVLAGLPIYGREPSLALDGGSDGLSLVRQLLVQARQVLVPGGLILLEIEATQGQAAYALARAAFSQAEVCLHQDLSGKDRLIEIRTSPYVHLSI